MIGTVYGEVGKPILLKGVAGDYGRAVYGVEFSLDDGEHWTRYETDEREPGVNLYWSFEYTPEKAGQYRMLIRSINENNEVSPEPATVYLSVE